MKILRFGLILAFLLTFGGCSGKQPVEQVFPILPPTALMQPGQDLLLPESGTNGDLLEIVLALIADKAEAEAAKQRLRQWREAHE